MAVAFALFGTFASFGIGSSVQSNSVAQAVQTSFSVEPAYTGIVLTVLTAIVLLGGIKGHCQSRILYRTCHGCVLCSRRYFHYCREF